MCQALWDTGEGTGGSVGPGSIQEIGIEAGLCQKDQRWGGAEAVKEPAASVLREHLASTRGEKRLTGTA